MNVEAIRNIPKGIRQDIINNLLDKQFSNKYCQKCKLYKDINNPYLEGRGDKNSKLLLLGEAPGKDEDVHGQVFIGRSGQILQNVLNRNNISYFISNAVKCRPTKNGKNTTPTPTEIKCCAPFTIKLIKEIEPTVIVTIGKIAMTQLLPLNLGITVARGKQFYHPELKAIIIPTYHPAYLGRANDRLLYQQFENDLKLAQRLVYRTPRRLISSTPVSLEDPIDIKNYLEHLLTAPAVAIDIETEGLDFKKDRITDISFCYSFGKGVHISWENMEDHFELLGQVLSSHKVKKVGHNFTFDMKFLRAQGFEINNFNFDTLLAEHTKTMSFEGNEVTGLYKLKTMCWEYTELGGYEQTLGKGGIVEAQKNRKNTKQKNEDQTEQNYRCSQEEIDNKELDEYNNYVDSMRNKKLEESGLEPIEYYSALDADVTFRIYQKQRITIEENYLWIFENIIIPLAYTLMKIEENGIKLNIDYMNSIYEENLGQINAYKEKLYKKAGGKFDIDSTPQLRNFVFNILKVQPTDEFKTPKGAYSLNVEALNYYSKKKPILKNILEYRKLAKQSSTYITGFKKHVSSETHKVHPSYLQFSTATGRLSCVAPPIQTIPRDNRIRNMIIPNEGNKLLVADLSQIELRMLAMISNDQAMLAAFESGTDFHTATACKMFKIPMDKFDKNFPKHTELRSVAKTINFGIVYGRGPGALAAQLEISFDEASKFINTFFTTYLGVKEWMASVINFTAQHGYVDTLYGRRRYLPKIHSSDSGERTKAERQAVNTIIQSSASDINNIALIRIQKFLDDSNHKALIVGCVHDSILLDCPESEIGVISKELISCMTNNIPRVTIPLKADLAILDKWEK